MVQVSMKSKVHMVPTAVSDVILENLFWVVGKEGPRRWFSSLKSVHDKYEALSLITNVSLYSWVILTVLLSKILVSGKHLLNIKYMFHLNMYLNETDLK